MTETPKFCPNCGAPLEPDAKFCIHCGYNLATMTAEINQSGQPQPQSTAQGQASNEQKRQAGGTTPPVTPTPANHATGDIPPVTGQPGPQPPTPRQPVSQAWLWVIAVVALIGALLAFFHLQTLLDDATYSGTDFKTWAGTSLVLSILAGVVGGYALQQRLKQQSLAKGHQPNATVTIITWLVLAVIFIGAPLFATKQIVPAAVAKRLPGSTVYISFDLTAKKIQTTHAAWIVNFGRDGKAQLYLNGDYSASQRTLTSYYNENKAYPSFTWKYKIAKDGTVTFNLRKGVSYKLKLVPTTDGTAALNTYTLSSGKFLETGSATYTTKARSLVVPIN